MRKTISLFLIFVLIFSLCSCSSSQKEEAYNNAIACFNNGRYEDATQYFIDAKGYKDSDQKLLEIYYYAVDCFENMNLTEAKSLFIILAEAEINESQNYLDACDFYDLFDNAKVQFEELHNVSSALEFIDEAIEIAPFDDLKNLASAYKDSIIDHLYDGTYFYQPNAPVEVIAAEPGKYIHYRYSYNDFNNYYGYRQPHELGFLAYAIQEYYETYIFEPTPEEIKQIIGTDSNSITFVSDGLGNLLHRIPHDSIDENQYGESCYSGYTDVFILYADYVINLKN